MPLATIHLVELSDPSQLVSFLHALKKLQPLVVSKVVRWIIRPTGTDAEGLLGTPWDLMVILPAAAQDSNLDGPGLEKLKMVKSTWSVTVGIPSRLTQNFAETNDRLLHPTTKPELTGALDHPRLGESSLTLELSRELLEWVNSFSQTKTGRSPLSMLNLLAFKPIMKESYLKYGRAFAESIGARRGGIAKLVGNVISADSNTSGHWHEFALASYPSILHFADMLASDDYQAVNLAHRVPALADTFILCTSEIEVEDLLAGGRASSKL